MSTLNRFRPVVFLLRNLLLSLWGLLVWDKSHSHVTCFLCLWLQIVWLLCILVCISLSSSNLWFLVLSWSGWPYWFQDLGSFWLLFYWISFLPPFLYPLSETLITHFLSGLMVSYKYLKLSSKKKKKVLPKSVWLSG